MTSSGERDVGVALLVQDVTAIPIVPARTVWERVDILVVGRDIAAIGPTGTLAVPPGARVLAGRGRLALPGLINCHNHVGIALLKATTDTMPLEPWLNWLIPRQLRMTAADLYWSALLSCLEQLQSGITTLADMHGFEPHCAPAVEQAGLRAVLSQSVMEADAWDGPPDDGLARLERSIEFALAWQGRGDGRISTRLAPHSVYTVRPSLLRAFAEQAGRTGLGLQVHCSETATEVAECQRRHGLTPPALLESAGCLEAPILLAHAVHLTDADLALLDRPRVGLSHNPGSNLKLQSGRARLVELVGRQLAVGLGTDSAASNDTQDLLKELYLATVLHPWPPGSAPAWQVLELATLDGARALGLADQVGSLEPGKRADLILLDQTGPRWTPGLDPVLQLAYTARASDVCTSIVDGRLLMHERRVLEIDAEAILREARARAARLLAEA